MSEEVVNTAAPICDQLLDYLYGELDAAQKQAFEAHLPSCARCQPEVASFGRTREAAQRLMPAVEPPANLTGALHAQLMHAASQRRPKRGVVLQLFRRVAQHPQMAAAAMFVIVGGAFLFSWRKAKLFPTASPTVSAPMAESPKPTEPNEGAYDKLAANESPAAAPAGEVGEVAPPQAAAKPIARKAAKRDEAEPLSDGVAGYGAKAKEIAPSFGVEAGKGGSGSGSVILKTPPADYTVDRSRHHAAAPAVAAAPPKAMRSVAKDENSDDLKRLQLDNGLGNVGGTVAGGGLGRGDVAKSTAPDTQALARMQSANARAQAAGPPPPPSLPAEPARAPSPNKQQSVATVERLQAQAPPSAAPAPVVASHDAEYDNAPREKAPVLKPTATTTAMANVETERKRFYDLAKSNRCDEAIKLFQDLERMTQFITPNERVQYVRCLTQKGRQQEAEQQLLELKADKRVTNNEVQKLQEEVDGARPKLRRADKKKATTTLAPMPVDQRRAEPAPESPSQQAQQAAPPPAASRPQPAATQKSTKTSTSY